MDNKDMVDNSSIPVIIKSEASNSVQLITVEIKKIEEDSDDLLKHDNKEIAVSSIPELLTVEETEKVESEKMELVPETSEEVIKINNPLQIEDTIMIVVESVRSDPLVEQPAPVSDQLISTNNLIDSVVPTQESLMEPTQDQIVPIGQESMMEGSLQVIPVTESDLNNDVKLDENGVYLDQQSVLSMKDSELNDLVMRELSVFLTEEPLQNVGPPLREIKPECTNNEDQ